MYVLVDSDYLIAIVCFRISVIQGLVRVHSFSEPVNNMIKSTCLTILLTVAVACAEIVTDPGSLIPADSRVVTGTVTYRERIALPAETIVHIQLLDVSLMDVSAKLITEQTLTLPHQVPIPFELVYRPLVIDERMTYAVRATISNGDQLLFVTDRSYPVLTRGRPEHIDLVLVRP